MLGDPTEAALIVAAQKAGMKMVALESEFPRVSEQPFDSVAKRMATVHRMASGKLFACVKGSPAAVLEASASQPVSGTSGTVVFTSAGLMAEVQSWLDTPAANFGWILLAQNETAAAVRFSAREGASPPSLQVSYTPSVPRHAADCAPADGQISQSELLRVIEIYNVRHGTIRTGRYAVATAVTVDGFAFDPATANNEVVTLMRYHSADTNRDGKLALFELTRVIELYQARVGGTRTGEYRVEADTEDGFAPGP